MKNPILIYIAGPLFSVAEREFNRRVADALKERVNNCTVVLPQEYAATVAGTSGFLQKVFNYSLEHIRKSDVVVAILDGPDADAGTCVEIGYAYAHKKPIIGIRSDFRASEDRGVNLMVSSVCTRLVWVQDSSVGVEPVLDAIAWAVQALFSSPRYSQRQKG